MTRLLTNKKVLLSAFLISFVTVLVYIPSLQNDFVNWDDDQFVYENIHIKSINIKFLKWMFTTFHTADWFPLTWLSHAADYAVWGLDPMGHHLTSVLVHGLNTFLVVMLVAWLVYKSGAGHKTPDNAGAASHPYHALIAGSVTGLLFGLHPLHVESVAWISERKDVLYSFFFLLCILAYVQYTSAETGKRKMMYYCLSLLLFIFSLMSKAMAVTLPVVLIILDYYPLGRLKDTSGGTPLLKVLAEKIPFIILSLASSVVTVMANKAGGGLTSADLLTLDSRILVAVRATGFYLLKMVWPSDLAPLYPYPSKISVFMTEYIAPLILFVLITAFCIHTRKKQKIWSAAWMYYLATLLPVIGIVQSGVQAAADRYTYLSSLGPFLLLGSGAAMLIRTADGKEHGFSIRKISALTAGVVTVAVILITLTVNQQKIWKDPLTLWSRELKIFPDGEYKVFNNLGLAYESRGLIDRAVELYGLAIKKEPDNPKAYINLGLAYESGGLLDRAIKQYETAIKLDPGNAGAHNNLGNAFKLSGFMDRAMEHYLISIKLNPDNPDAYNNLGSVYKSLGFTDKAIEQYRTAIALDPDSPVAYYNLGSVCDSGGLIDEAIENYKTAIALKPDYPDAHNNLGIALESRGLIDEAMKHYRTAVALKPDDPNAHYNIGRLYHMQGLDDRAIENYKIAAALKPDDPDVHNNLGLLYYKKGDRENSEKEFKKVLQINPRHYRARQFLDAMNRLK